MTLDLLIMTLDLDLIIRMIRRSCGLYSILQWVKLWIGVTRQSLKSESPGCYW